MGSARLAPEKILLTQPPPTDDLGITGAYVAVSAFNAFFKPAYYEVPNDEENGDREYCNEADNVPIGEYPEEEEEEEEDHEEEEVHECKNVPHNL